MASTLWTTVGRWLGFAGALGAANGQQIDTPSTTLVDGTSLIGADGALQLSTVWACVDRRATTIASLPLVVYEQDAAGNKIIARDAPLYQLLHDSPNWRMTPFEFWRAMMLNHDLRGNAYARIDRNVHGSAVALWPMPADQVVPFVLDDGSMAYQYYINGDVAVLAERSVLHLKNLGNGTTGLSKLEFMRATTTELAKAQQNATRLFGDSGKPTGVLMVDRVLKPEQRDAIRAEFAGLVAGSTARLAVLEASMKYEQVSISPEDQQLLETRKFGVEEICRWFDTPPVLVHNANVTAWGSGIEQIVDGFYKFTVRPMAINIEQSVRRCVMGPRERARLVAEYNMDALLRGAIKDRFTVYAQGVQNGITTRNEARARENLPPVAGGDVLTAQTNLVPLDMLGKVPASFGAPNAGVAEPVNQ